MKKINHADAPFDFILNEVYERLKITHNEAALVHDICLAAQEDFILSGACFFLIIQELTYHMSRPDLNDQKTPLDEEEPDLSEIQSGGIAAKPSLFRIKKKLALIKEYLTQQKNDLLQRSADEYPLTGSDNQIKIDRRKRMSDLHFRNIIILNKMLEILECLADLTKSYPRLSLKNIDIFTRIYKLVEINMGMNASITKLRQ